MQHEFADIADNKEGRLRIGIGSTRGRTILPGILEAFSKSSPRVHIHSVEDKNDNLLSMLDKGCVDLIIANIPEKVSGIKTAFFYDDEIVMLVSGTLLETLYGVAAQEIIDRASLDISVMKKCPFLMTGPNDISGRIGRSLLDKAKLIPNISVQSDNVETLLDMCQRGMGACFCPEKLAEMFLDSHVHASKPHMVHFTAENTRYPIRFGWKTEMYTWSIMEQFMQVARKVVNGED